MANSLLVNVPDKKAHAALSILVKGRILTPYVIVVGAIKYIVKLIAEPEPECYKVCTGEDNAGGQA